MGSFAWLTISCSEETETQTHPEKGRRMWIVDPLDGTACFVFRQAPNLVSVLIALYDCDLERVVCGVELFPIGPKPRLLYAALGKGAWADGRRLSIPKAVQVPLKLAWVNLNHYSDITYETAQVAHARIALRTPGTACRMLTTLSATSGVAAQILCGEERMSAIIHDNDTRSVKQGPWDTAAVQLLVEEAGGVFVNGITGERYDTLKPSLVVIAATQELADEIRALWKDI